MISKSKYLAGLQCSKLVWHHFNAKDKIPEYDDEILAIFEQGHLVGEYAKKLFPGGLEIGKDIYAPNEVMKLTAEAIKQRKPLFEAGLKFGNAFARPDILDPVGKNLWDLFEVKSSSAVKPVNLEDVAMQRYVYEGAGLKIRKCHIVHINKNYVRKGEIDPKKLFVIEDVTKDVACILPHVGGQLKDMQAVIDNEMCPDIPIGPYCDKPYGCPLHEMCWAFLPDKSVFDLHRGGAKAFKLLKENIAEMRKIPHDYPLTESQKIQVKSVRTGKPHVDRKSIKGFLSKLKYPMFFLDFETISSPIPLYDLSKPHKQVPFQYSLHIVRSPNEEPEHFEFLAEGKGDPRPEILRRLKDLLGNTGSIIAYNASFEKRTLNESVEAYPEYKSWNAKIQKRFVDLWVPFRGFFYYHPNQHGSASIKSVLPALTGEGYETLDIREGGTASREFYRISFGESTNEQTFNVREQLFEYCALDTAGMVSLVKKLFELLLPERAQPK